MTTRRPDKLEIYPRQVRRGDKRVRRWFWRLRSAWNGKIKASGQTTGFASKRHARRAWGDVFEVKVVEIIYLEG